jgi:hypothetical protein
MATQMGCAHVDRMPTPLAPTTPVAFGTFGVMLDPVDGTALYLDFTASGDSTLLTRQMNVFTTPERQAIAIYLRQLRRDDAAGSLGQTRVADGVTRALAQALGCEPANVHLLDFALRIRRPPVLPGIDGMGTRRHSKHT